MHPKSSRKSRHRIVGEPKIPAFPLQRRRPRPTPGTWFLFLLALVTVGAGVLTRFGEGFDPQLVVVGETMNAWGLDPGTLFVGGLVLLGVAMTSRHQRVHAAAILAPGSLEEALTEIGADVAELRNKLYDLGNDQLEVRTLVQSMRLEAEQHHRADRTDEVVEATFKVAGSLDTLHAKLDQRVGSAQESLAHGLYELAQLVEASRDFLQESLEEGQHAHSNLGEEIRRQLDGAVRTMTMSIPPQIVVHGPAAAAMMQPIASSHEVASGEKPAVEPALQPAGGEAPKTDEPPTRLGKHHDANAWFRAEEDAAEDDLPDSTDPSALEEESEPLRITVPDEPPPAPSGAQETRLGLLDRFDEAAEDTDAEAAPEEATPMSVLDGMERAMVEDQLAAEREGPLEVRFDQPPQAPGHVSPRGPDGTTVVRLDDPSPALPAAPPAAKPSDALPPSWKPSPRSS